MLDTLSIKTEYFFKSELLVLSIRGEAYTALLGSREQHYREL